MTTVRASYYQILTETTMLRVYQLRAYLRNLSLAGYDDNDYQWVGTRQEWNKADKEIAEYELFDTDFVVSPILN